MGIIDVVKYEGDNRTFISKYPDEDFNTSSQLIVHESQEAIFFLNGQALDLFGPGRHTLETQNIPVLNKIINLPTDGVSPFHAEVYFINLVEQMGIAWGTSSKVQYMDPELGFPLSIGASGEMSLAVADSRRLLLKLVGTEAILSQESLIKYFRAFLQTRIKTLLANTITEQKLCIFEMDAQLEKLSASLKSKLASDFAEYGLKLTQFFVTTIVRPEGDEIYERFKDLYFRQYADVREAEIEQQVGVIEQETAAKRTVIGAKATAEKRQIEGYTYHQERGFDIAEQMAQNEAVGEFTNLGIGMGMVGAVGTPVAGMVGGAMSEAFASTSGASNPQPSAQSNDPVETLKKLKQLLDLELISQEGYDAKVNEILGRM